MDKSGNIMAAENVHISLRNIIKFIALLFEGYIWMAAIIAPKRPKKDMSSIMSALFTRYSYNGETGRLQLQAH